MSPALRWVAPLLVVACAPTRPASGGDAATTDSPAAPVAREAASPAPPPCDPDNGGITLPRGFCAVVFADSVPGVRHLAAGPAGVLYGALGGRRGAPSGVVALQDADGDGRAEVRRIFGSEAGTGIAVAGEWLYFAPNDGVVRWRLGPGVLVPAGGPERIVTDLPTGGHTAKSIALDGRGALFVNVGSRSNACQQQDRQAGSRGLDPCTELETRAGVWRFDAERAGQTQAQGERFATGARNPLALAVRPEDGTLYAAIHGRDQLHQNWPALFDERKSAENPAEEFVRVERGADFGWPYCYHDVDVRRKVLAPEYGGDGTTVGRCARAADALIAFPGHWAPEALVFYTGTAFPERYRGGAFLSFHGSWNRAPLPQAGYNVVFIPFAGSDPGQWEVFADGFAGPAPSPQAPHRPMGLAVGPDGSLYIGDDAGGRIWRVYYRGE